jgi:regulator of sigma E protease
VTSILAFLFVLGVLIFVHEFGHFIMARRIGVRVITFSLGFGPKLLTFRRGDTEYCISAIPLGGYVKMAGETPEDARTGSSDEFLSKSKWQRFQVLVMGPVMNLALAVIVMALVLNQGAKVPVFEDLPVVLGGVASGSVAQAAGLQAGDRVISVDDKQMSTWNQFYMAIATRANRPVRLTIDRQGQRIERQVVPAAVDRFETGAIGVLPVTHPQISVVNEGQPAHESGLRGGDIVLAAAGEANLAGPPNDIRVPLGQPVADIVLADAVAKRSWDRLIEVIQAHDGRPLALELQRGDSRLTVTVTPRVLDGRPRIGAQIASLEVKTVEPGPIDAVKLSLKQNWEWTTLIFETLGGLFTRQTSVKQLMGPVAIADLSGSAAAQESWIPLFQLMAMISLNLGLLNLMPIPVLDGGHIAILALEGVSRRDFSMHVKEKMLLAGFVLLMMLMVTVIYNDLMRIQWIERLVPWR